MKAFAIIGAIVSAWISGAAASGESARATNGAVVFLVVAMLLGIVAWSAK